ncbi:MAG: DUF6430 domain-containing protein, partial [Candidatus Poribacteria bacterium]|nr:DUF6430 domain-containing protein [Candidatus Poribacteria bacterium]
NLLASFGAIRLVVVTVSFSSESAKVFLSTKGWWVFAIGLLIACFLSRPKKVFRCQLKGRDVTIEIRIADAFEVSGDLVVPINTTFDTDLDGRIPKAHSIQGEFIRRYYDAEVSHLDLDIDEALGKENYCYKEPPEKTRGKKRRYPIGTVIQLERKERLFYLVANTHINNNGVASTSIENLRESLAKLWYYISEKGSKGDIVIPLLGTGKARLSDKREDIFLEIIRSFIASCSSGTYCDKLIVAIYPPDVTKHKIDLNDLRKFLEYSCKYARFES